MSGIIQSDKTCANCSRFEKECIRQDLLLRPENSSDYCKNWREPFMNPPIIDNVNHPSHYETGKFECIDVMLETQGKEAVMDFCICNAFKYIYRHNGKNGLEDIKKAQWYINKYIELAEKA